MLRKTRYGLQIVVGVALIGVALALAGYWLSHKPRATKQAAPPILPAVSVLRAQPLTHPITIEALGEVIAARRVTLTPEVEGRLVEIAPGFVEGGIVKQGELLARIDPTDYMLRVRQRQGDVARARFELALEMGQQAIARREYELFGQGLDEQAKTLVLRQPHLRAAQAALDAAQAALQQAELDLARTRLTAPFAAVVLERGSELGARVTSNTPLVTLAASDAFWVEVTLPLAQLSWLDIPGVNAERGSRATLTYPPVWGTKQRYGHIKRLFAQLEPQGRLARLIVEVKDPLCLEPRHRQLPRLLLGMHVQVALHGAMLTNVIALPETAWRNDDSVWLVEDDRLRIVPVTLRWREAGRIFIDARDLPPQARIITSMLAAPVPGMRVQVREAPTADTP